MQPSRGSSAGVKGFAPLADWYAAAGRTLPPVDVIPGEEIPQPYRWLLVHLGDMTSTLESFHRGKIHVRVLSSERSGADYRREVVLTAGSTGKPVEYGAICIHVDVLPTAARDLVLAAQRPFGAILHDCGVAYTSRPSAFFRIRSDETIRRALGLEGDPTLYGRCNQMHDDAGRPIAEIVEILPP